MCWPSPPPLPHRDRSLTGGIPPDVGHSSPSRATLLFMLQPTLRLFYPEGARALADLCGKCTDRWATAHKTASSPSGLRELGAPTLHRYDARLCSAVICGCSARVALACMDATWMPGTLNSFAAARCSGRFGGHACQFFVCVR